MTSFLQPICITSIGIVALTVIAIVVGSFGWKGLKCYGLAVLGVWG